MVLFVHLLPARIMAGLLSEALLREKLTKLNTTQQVIETTSTWCCFFPKEARRIALVWEDVFSKSDQPKRLALVYLASDVVQNRWEQGCILQACTRATLPGTQGASTGPPS